MNDIIIYLENLKKSLNITSNNQLAIRTGIRQQTMDAIMKNKMIPGDEHCERISKLSGDKPEYVIALAHKCRAKGDSIKYWDKILKAVTAATFISLFILNSSAFASTTHSPAQNKLTECILCQIVTIW